MKREDYTIIDVEWDHQKIKYKDGKKGKLIRGVDYDTNWVKLGEGYAKRGNEITWFDKRKFAKFYSIIDFASFQLIESYKTSTNYFKDKNNVYLDSYMHRDLVLLEGANPIDFKILDIKKGFATSNNIDYYYYIKLPHRFNDMIFIEGDSYQKVGNQIYFNFTQKLDCDADTFEIVDKREYHKTVFKDKNHLYHKGNIVENVNPKMFRFIENCINESLRPRYTNCDIHFYAKDDKFAYFVDSVDKIKTIKTKDLSGFDFKVVDGEGIAFDKYYEYYRGVKKRKTE